MSLMVEWERIDDEALHSDHTCQLSGCAYTSPTVDLLPTEANPEQKNKHLEQTGALKFYNARREEDILCKFIINGLN